MDNAAQWIGIISGVLGILGFFGLTGFRRPEWATSREDVINKTASSISYVCGGAALGGFALPWSYASGSARTVTTGALGGHGVTSLWQYVVADLALLPCVSLLASIKDVQKRKSKVAMAGWGGVAALAAALLSTGGNSATAHVAGVAYTHVSDRVGFDIFAVGAGVALLGSAFLVIALID